MYFEYRKSRAGVQVARKWRRCFTLQQVLLLLFLATCGVLSPMVQSAPPRVLVDGYTLERVAAEPNVVTPVAIGFTSGGDLLVVESHTHQRPDEYKGSGSDRIRRYSDSDGDGKFDTWSTFAEGFRFAMNLQVRSDDAVIVVTRSEVVLLCDTNGDGTADERTTLVLLNSEVDYPHNALSGFAFDREGGFFLGLGENFGGAYRLVGSDGEAFEDSGGTGMVFHFAGDGSKLTRVAQGFWNPFGLCLVGNHTLFAVDNDPNASPPCRLIHVVPTGDYGHRFDLSSDEVEFREPSKNSIMPAGLEKSMTIEDLADLLAFLLTMEAK